MFSLHKPQPKKEIRYATYALLLIAVLLLTACVASTAPGAQPAADAPAVVAQELIIGAPKDTYRIDERASVGAYPVNAGIYDTLVTMTSDYQVQPMLATEWEFVEPNTWRFKLREGVTFHDGQPFNAAAVQYTVELILKAPSNSAGLDATSLKVIDDYTVEITPSRPNRRLIQQLVHPQYGIKAPGSDPAAKLVGTGPFQFVEYVKDDQITVVRNENYWGGKALLDKLTFRFIPDDNTRVLALKAGEVQMIYDAPRELTADIESTDGLKIVTSPVGAYEAIYVAIHGAAPYDIGSDPQVRAAIAQAIDKTAIVRDVWQGNAEENHTMIPVRILGDAATLVASQAYDPAQAQTILEEAGWVDSDGDGIREKAGRKLSLVMIVGFPTPEIHRPLPELVQAQLKAIGIEVSIVVTPDTATYEERMKAGEGDLWVELGNQNDANPCFLPALLFRTDAPAEDYAKLFAPGDAFDQFVDACQEAVTPEEVASSAANAMKVIIEQEHVIVPIAGVFRIYGMQETIQGFVANPSRTSQRWDLVSIGE